MDEETELLRQQLAQMSMKLAERDAAWAERNAALTAERALMTAAVVRARTMELDAALASWEAAERSLETMVGVHDSGGFGGGFRKRLSGSRESTGGAHTGSDPARLDDAAVYAWGGDVR